MLNKLMVLLAGDRPLVRRPEEGPLLLLGTKKRTGSLDPVHWRYGEMPGAF